MNVPQGYTALDLVGFTDKGVYNSATNYVQNDLVHYGGNIWRCLIDDTTNIAPSEGLNWTLWIGEPTNLTEAIIAPLEVSPATDAHSVGDQLIFNDVLYKVISAISIGDSLTVGTNIEAARKIVYQISGIESDIATIEPTATASKNYAVGEYMFFGWEFYRVTTAITAGDTIVTTGAGQNVEEVTVGGELTSINSHLAQKANQSDISAIVENGANASQQLYKGQIIYRNGSLYRVIADIASGSAFTSSNITATTIGADKVNKAWIELVGNWTACSSFTMPSVSWSDLLVIVKLKSGNFSSFQLASPEFSLMPNSAVSYKMGGFSTGSSNNVGIYIHKSNGAFDYMVVFENGIDVTSNSTYKSYYKAYN